MSTLLWQDSSMSWRALWCDRNSWGSCYSSQAPDGRVDSAPPQSLLPRLAIGLVPGLNRILRQVFSG